MLVPELEIIDRLYAELVERGGETRAPIPYSQVNSFAMLSPSTS